MSIQFTSIDPDNLPPPQRDLAVLVTNIRATEAELWHQVKRLDDSVQARTESEATHLVKLREQYKEAAHAVRVLRRYHEGRLERLHRHGTTAVVDTTPAASAIDERGVATPYFGDE